jgi:general secretion pathway protein B
MLKQLKVSELIPGMMVTQVIEQHGPAKIRKVGFIRSADMIRGLSEMGVSVVEVDINQSLHVELEDDEDAQGPSALTTKPNTSNTDSTSTNDVPVRRATATQRLVASNRQIADVDRQLSQQFHRSLFLPAVDQMPSKWMLYGKPYTLLLMFILCGFAIGSATTTVMSGMLYAKDSTEVSSINTTNSDSGVVAIVATVANVAPITNTSAISGQSLDRQDEPSSDSSPNEKSINSGMDVNTQTQNLPNVTLSTSSEQTANAGLYSLQDSVNAAKPSVERGIANNDIANNDIGQSAQPFTIETINGVELEEGQQVLGYQSGSEDDINTNSISQRGAQTRVNRAADNDSSASNESSNERLNPTLLRRIQAAAQDIDSQEGMWSQEILKVTDLNALPRIDQLPPAVLTQMPAMSFSAHMYASNPRDRWVRVNSQRLSEGDIIANNVVLKRIESEKVVLEYKGDEFTMNALSDW